ncbi:MAG: 4'-phosphopantetheinyl transferase superfamily protein [Lachnospira sp.]|nr:4'-phosphopantetheinyl transferase superfamily protein [Lachnospira sp.]
MFIITLTDINPLIDSYQSNGIFYQEALSLVPDYRREKIERVRAANDKCRSLAAGLLLNYSIGRFFSCRIEAPPLQIIPLQTAINYYNPEFNFNVTIGQHGKPYFTNHPELFFNLSHSGNYAVCIISDKDCGIDIEGGRNVKLNVAKRFFSEREYSWITETADISEQKERFFRIWTLKEAYAKLTGMGIAEEISKVEYIADSTCGRLDFADLHLKEEYSIIEYLYDNFNISAILRI